MTSFSAIPWNVPVPIRPAPDFLPLHPEHAGFAVVTDLAALDSFGLGPGARGTDDLAAADLQTNVDMNAVGRLGSGRAVFYRGKYLKGVGRTPLAANWVDPEDVYHNSGHLFASGAARELLVSALARELGFEHAIVPCEGVLVRRLDSRLSGALARSLPDRYSRVQRPGADEALQAITIKPGAFARLSNLTWLWNNPVHAAGGSFVVTAARLSHAAFAGPRGGAADAALSPPVIVAALGSAIRQGVANCLRFIAGGVYWGSFHNNFTADGRFLDLELPTLTGGDFLGVASAREDGPPTAEWPGRAVNVGTEVLSFLAQARQFIRYWDNRLRWLAEHGRYLGSLERQFCLGLAECLQETFTPASLSFNGELVRAQLVDHYRTRLALGPAQVEALEQLLAEADTGGERRWAFERLPVDLPDSEPGTKMRLYFPSFLRDVLHRPADRWQAAFGDVLHRVDGEARPERWLAELRNYQALPNPLELVS
jgi:hypothetical protein